MKKLERRFLLIDALFEGGRMFVGGLSAVFLLSRGFDPSTIALVKTVQALVVFFGEVPTGILSDKYGRKFSLLAGAFSSALGLILYLYSPHMAGILAAEAFCALSLCLWSGAFEAWAVDESKLPNSHVEKFFHINSSINQVTVVMTGLFAAYLVGAKFYENAYLAAIVSMLLLVVVICFTPETTHVKADKFREKVSMTKLFTMALDQLQSNSEVRKATFMIVGLQFLVQPILHYWQPLLQKSAVWMDARMLNYAFAFFCASSAVVSYLFRNKQNVSFKIVVTAWTASFMAFSLTQNPFMLVGLIAVSQSLYGVLKTKVGSILVRNSAPEIRASILGTSNFVGRIGMIASLGITSLYFKVGAGLRGETSYTGLYTLYGMIAGILILGLSANKLSAYLKKSSSKSLQTEVDL